MVFICVPATNQAPPAAAWAAPSMGYGYHQYPWLAEAAWGVSSPHYPPPAPRGRGAHDEAVQCGRGGGRVGRGRGRRGRVRGSGSEPPSPSGCRSRARSQPRNTLTIGTSSNSVIGDDGDASAASADDGVDSDYESDNESSVITLSPPNVTAAFFQFRVTAVVSRLLIATRRTYGSHVIRSCSLHTYI